MHILIVTATNAELAPLAANLGAGAQTGPKVKHHKHAHHDIDVLTTGIGMVATAAWCSRVLMQNRYDMAFNFGVCGNFDPTLELAQVVHVVSDRLAELGAEDDEAFLTLEQLGLSDDDEFPFKRGQLLNLYPSTNTTLRALKAVSGITVNTVHGNERSIEVVAKRFKPQVESMEGAAFMYACLIHEVAFAQVRAVSNVVKRRNREAWRMTEAITNLGEVALRILEDT
jgi:futalosine hydrolase